MDVTNQEEWDLPENWDEPDAPAPRRRGRRLVLITVACLALAALLVGGLYAVVMARPVTPTQQAMAYLQNHDLNYIEAAGVVGNLAYESGMDPAAVQTRGPGRGLGQWDVNGPVWHNVLSVASRTHRSPTNLQVQLEVLWADLTGREAPALQHLRTAANVELATTYFAVDYLKSGIPNLPRRIALAQQAVDGTS